MVVILEMIEFGVFKMRSQLQQGTVLYVPKCPQVSKN